MDQYKKPKLKLKKRKSSVTKPPETSMKTPSVEKPKGLKLKKASVDVKMSDEAPKKKAGKITRIKRGVTVPKLDARQMKSYRRMDLEGQTDAMTKDAMKEAMEKARLKRAKKERMMIKRIK